MSQATPSETIEYERFVDKLRKSNAELMTALNDLVGYGAQHEDTCDEAEHDEESGCIYCEARKALDASRPVENPPMNSREAMAKVKGGAA